MSEVRQILAAAAPGDAVTGQALAWGRLLGEWGVGGEIVAEHVDPRLAGKVRRLADAPDLEDGPVVLHMSVGGDAVEAALAAPGPLAACYHNITPGHLLRPFNPVLAELCDRGRAALPRVARKAVATIADSAFNAAELTAAGADGTVVVPLLLDLPAPPAPTARPGPPSVVSVGRIVPNKRLEDAVRAFVLLQRRFDADATLTLVGSDGGFERYRDAVEGLARRLGARNVRFTGWIGDDEVAAAYRGAHAYLCMSEHEGFCVPLLEAMARGVPVVARDAGAVRETVGGAGLVIEHDVELAAEALHEVTANPATRAGLAEAATARLAELGPARVAGRLRAALAPLLGAA